MAFTAKILSWRFRHLNIVGCLLKRRPTKGGSRAPQDPPPPPPHLATPLAEDKREAREGDDGNERRAQAGTAFSPLSIIHSWLIHFCY